MFQDNNANRLRKEILIRVAGAIHAKGDPQALDRVPLDMRPRAGMGETRCCIYKDRAVIKYRCMAALGYRVEDETDELKSLHDYLDAARCRDTTCGPALTVIDEACQACVQSCYAVTNACQGCVARPCQTVCPKNAMRMKEGKAWIEAGACVNCGLCMKACPYHAIIRIPIPCEEACPVGAITRDHATGRQRIDADACISCGKCLRECPFAAIAQTSHMADVLLKLDAGVPLTALVAPSVVGQFPGAYAQTIDAIVKLGFDAVYEVASGAEQTTRHECAELVERLAQGAPFMTTSCCPAYIEAVRKHIPEIAPFVSETKTPMGYIGDIAKRERPEAKTVFIGPCIAKRIEAERDPNIDFVLTFEELGAMLIAFGIDVLDCPSSDIGAGATGEGRGFAATGGVGEAIAAVLDDPDVSMTQVDGLDRKTLKQLKMSATKKSAEAAFVEVMCCEGGCIGGPGATGSPRSVLRQLKELKATSRPINGKCR